MGNRLSVHPVYRDLIHTVTSIIEDYALQTMASPYSDEKRAKLIEACAGKVANIAEQTSRAVAQAMIDLTQSKALLLLPLQEQPEPSAPLIRLPLRPSSQPSAKQVEDELTQ